MIITKKQIVVVVFAFLFLLAISPYAKAQEEVNPPDNGSVALIDNNAANEESAYLVKDLAANAATKLRIAISQTRQILGRLESRREKLASPENSLSEVSELANSARQLLTEASQSLENIESHTEAIFMSEAGPQESWGEIGFRFNQARENIRNAQQQIFNAAIIMQTISGEASYEVPEEVPDVN